MMVMRMKRKMEKELYIYVYVYINKAEIDGLEHPKSLMGMKIIYIIRDNCCFRSGKASTRFNAPRNHIFIQI